MFSYIFMKILENRPERYDKRIYILSWGHAKEIRMQIVQIYVKPGMEILDIGCGTGSLIIDAAKAGAVTTGVDISTGMLAVAKKRIANSGMQERITLHNAGAAEIDSLFEENSFDLIISTLVFSELYAEERALTLNQIKKNSRTRLPVYSLNIWKTIHMSRKRSLITISFREPKPLLLTSRDGG